MRSWKSSIAIVGMLALGFLGLPAFGADQARPGTVNYVEGAVYLDGQPLNNKDVGSTEMAPGQVLSTREGKAEVLLNPGIYLRLDDNSAVKMISPDLTPTRVEVDRGRAAVEVDQLLKQNVVQIMDHGITTQLVKTGYYEFNSDSPRVEVFKGQAEVERASDQWQKVKGDHELALVSAAGQKESKFQPDPQEDQLMNWSKLRSQYLAEANNEMAEQDYGPGFYPGWYWDPWMWGYTYLGASPFYSPFGWGFYPMGIYGGYGWGGGWYGRGFGGFARGVHAGMAGGFHGGMGGGSHGR